MKIKKFDRPTLRAFRPELDAALKELGDKHGIVFTVGGIRFETNSFRATVEATIAGDRGEAERVAFERDCAVVGLVASDFGKTFTQGRKTYTVFGVKTRSYQYPVLARDENGKAFKFPVEVVNRERVS